MGTSIAIVLDKYARATVEWCKTHSENGGDLEFPFVPLLRSRLGPFVARRMFKVSASRSTEGLSKICENSH